MSGTSTKQMIAFVADERDSAALYDTLASVGRDARLADGQRRPAATERRHADHWLATLQSQSVSLPPHKPGWRTRVLQTMARRFGAGTVISIVANQEVADAHKYAATSDRLPGMD